MKKILLFSISLAALLNLFQFASSYHQRQAAFAPALANQTGVSLDAKPAKPANPITSKAATVPSIPTVTAPAPTDPATKAAAKLAATGFKSDYAALYLSVQTRTGVPWQLLASVHKIETGQRGSTTITSYAGAKGPMQFMPATFSAYGRDGDGDGAKVITDLEDSMLSAGTYLAANGANRGQYRNALYRYNHSWSYVSTVLSNATRLGL